MYSQLTLVGYLGSDPTMRFMPSGDPVTSFSVATSRSWTKDGVKTEETTWWRVSAFGGQAEVCNTYLHKGSLVLVAGRLRPDENGGPRVYERKDGTYAASFEVTASDVRFLGGKNAMAQDVGDDLPF